jgi:hypothetical protein
MVRITQKNNNPAISQALAAPALRARACRHKSREVVREILCSSLHILQRKVAILAERAWSFTKLQVFHVRSAAMKMRGCSKHSHFWGILLFLMLTITPSWSGEAPKSFIDQATVDKVRAELLKGKGAQEPLRRKLGPAQAASLWRESDGGIQEFAEFCTANFVGGGPELAQFLARCESNLESIHGHLHEINRHINEPLQLDRGPILPIDYLFGDYSPSAHVLDDLFKTRVAFAVLLNFPLYSLNEKLEKGPSWTEEQWAMARLPENFDVRIPADVQQKINSLYTGAENYISSYNIYMHNLLGPSGTRPFPEGLKLNSHWGIRDELKGQYRNKEGLLKQEMIVQLMERIIRQEIPQIVINNPEVDYDPFSNKVYSKGKEIAAPREKDTRYLHLENTFRAACLVDPYIPQNPTHILRRFNIDREMPEKTVEANLVAVLSSPVIKRTGKLIEKRLGRKLRPFDVWYNGFRSTSTVPEADLDRIVRERYPNAEALQRDLPNILMKLGFAREKALYLAERIVIDPSRGSGHAMGAERKGDKCHLRTRFAGGTLDYKGFNIAAHELGHCVEEVFSLYEVEHYEMSGVPNTAFTEAFAFVFQARDLSLLGIEESDGGKEQLKTLGMLWDTYELGGVALMDMRVWHWMYDHPMASEEELKQAVIAIAKDIWNAYYAPVLGERDMDLFAIYSHLIDSGLYLPDYPIGHIIQFQLEDHLRRAPLATEMERMCRQGHLTPDLWMKRAVGAPVSPASLLRSSDEVLTSMGM